MSDFKDDFTEANVMACLDQAGLKWKDGSRYILSQCPTHDDANPSVQIFKKDWFVNCLAGCGRYHITKAFPELNPNLGRTGAAPIRARQEKPVEHEYKDYDLYGQWAKLPLIPRSHKFKNIPLQILDDLGWRYLSGEIEGMGHGYFIPYFDPYKQTIPFAQTRHLDGDRRFTFLKDARPTAYGKWNILNNKKLFVVEGTSDGAVMEFCGIPWIAMPSASSAQIIRELALFCREQKIKLVYAGDNDTAGDKLKEALGEVISYRVCQPPKQFKDWGDYFESVGEAAVLQHCVNEIFDGDPVFPVPEGEQ